MAELVARIGLQRESGFLYYLDQAGDIARIRPDGTDEQKVARLGVKKHADYYYFIFDRKLGREGEHVCRVKRALLPSEPSSVQDEHRALTELGTKLSRSFL